ncbi:hypothetical protein AB1J88_03175 [Pseudomonas sp. S8]|uniref:hypothetical protein n=1 Tax=Pseudomonas sp. S8 TaxID=211136 RepID=UPI003D2D1321
MKFEPVGLNDQMIVEETVNVSYALKIFCGQLLDGLKKAFEVPGLQAKFGVEFSFGEGLDSQVKSPLGNARGSLDVQIIGQDIIGRYVFEKNVISDAGLEAWIPIWALKINKYGIVLLGDEGSIEIDAQAINQRGTAITAVARSLLYRIGITPKFQ